MTFQPELCDGEVIARAAGAPCLYKYQPADKDKPLVVLIPGAVHNARIFYGGHPGYEPEHFLSTWLTRMGFGALAISYPVESEPQILPAEAPGFRIRDWGRQAAEVTENVMEAHELRREVVLVGWSMGGKVLIPYCKRAKDLGINVKLFVSLSATPGLPGLRSRPPAIEQTRQGYATVAGFLSQFLRQLHEQRDLNDAEVAVPDQAYQERYFAHTPVSLLGYGLKYPNKPEFIDDEGLSVNDAAAHEFDHLPWISSLTSTSQLDARHALSDKATWSFMLIQKLRSVVETALKQSQASQESWEEILALFDSIPSTLSSSIEGTHFFFVGRKGAKATAEGIIQQLGAASQLESRLLRVLGISTFP